MDSDGNSIKYARGAEMYCICRKWIITGLILSGVCFGRFNADLDSDKYVGLNDLAIIASHWLDNGNPGCLGDTGSDCQINMTDLAKLSGQWQWMECVSSATASSVENASLGPSNAIDGSLGTRWSSSFNDNQWLQIHLGQVRNIYGLTIYWEAAYARVYNVQVSNDAGIWTTVYSTTTGNGGTDDISFAEQSMVYIRINCITRATQYGSSIYEVELKSDDSCQGSSATWNLVWSDEFGGPNINTSNWNWETGAGGWGNNEWQYYTNNPDNSYISNGSLVIAARKNHMGYNYTSARMTTKNKQSFMYGRMEARIKLPAGGPGMWPAFWMLGNNISSVGWPECGEIDILEAVNYFTEVVGAVHYGTSNPYVHDYNSSGYNPGLNVSADYHVYAIEWEPTEIRWYFDGVIFRKTSTWWNSSPYPAPFNLPFFFILNIAVGGNWPGYPDASTPFPQYMYIDYVRVYQKTP